MRYAAPETALDQSALHYLTYVTEQAVDWLIVVSGAV